MGNTSPVVGKTNEPLPGLLKVIAVLAILGGSWNALGGIIITFGSAAPGTLASRPEIKGFAGCAMAVGTLAAISAIALLRRKEIGRKGLILSLGLVLVGFVAWAVVSWHMTLADAEAILPTVITLAISTFIGFAVIGGLVGVCIWYLSKNSTRRFFSHEAK